MRLIVCFTIAILLAGCTHGPTYAFEPFSRNKLTTLSRAIAGARDAQQASTKHLVESVEMVSSPSLEGSDPGTTYDEARRALMTAQSRKRNARERIQSAAARGDDLFGEWAVELTEYEDPALRKQSAAERDGVKALFQSAINALEAADGATPPLVEVIGDRVLYFKHHRSKPTLPPLPANAKDPAPLVQALKEATEVAVDQANQFIASVPPSPTTTPPSPSP